MNDLTVDLKYAENYKQQLLQEIDRLRQLLKLRIEDQESLRARFNEQLSELLSYKALETRVPELENQLKVFQSETQRLNETLTN